MFFRVSEAEAALAGHHTLHDITNKKRFSTIMKDGMTWRFKKLPSAGASQFVVDDLALAESTPIGPGVRQRTFWKTQEGALIFPNQYAPTAGLGGVLQGQYLSQPLYDPYNGIYGNINGAQT